MKNLILISVIMLVSAGITSANDLATFKATYEKSLEPIIFTYATKMTDLGKQYTESLEALLANVQKQGDLEKTKAVMAEIARFNKDKVMPPKPSNMPGIKNGQARYAQVASALEADRARSVLALVTKYDQALERVQRKYVTSGSLDLAEAVQKERNLVQESHVVVASKALAASYAKLQASKQPTINGTPKPAPVNLNPTNVALASLGAKATAPKGAANLNDGNSTKYTGSKGFAHGTVPCDLGVELSKPTKISSIRFLLWDGDNRSYRYKAEISIDGRIWKTVADHRKNERKGWQEIKFPYQFVKYIKVQGLHNTKNKGFHIVELEAY
jgi:hypothetical protein